MAIENSNKGLTAVIGGTGRVGSCVVNSLLQNGFPVRVLTRSQEKLEKLPEGVEGLVGSPQDPSVISKLMEEARNVFFVSLHDKNEEQIGRSIITESERAGVNKLVFASAAYPNPKNPIQRKAMWTLIGLMSPHYKPKMRLDAKVRKMPTGIVLMPSNFFQNDEVYRKDIMEEGVYPQPLGEKGSSRIDTRDIGDAAARVLIESGHTRKAYPVVGPTLNGKDCAAVWSEVLGKPVQYAGDNLDDWDRRVEGRFASHEQQDFRKTYKLMQKVGFGVPSGDLAEFEKLLQKPLRSYSDYVKETVKMWENN
jgi:uncharacterized protein YbjT (DUF2867 family)